ncbi:MAG: hypothetical protein ACF8R7_05795 [Phycisphaerales bacterium JB039]
MSVARSHPAHRRRRGAPALLCALLLTPGLRAQDDPQQIELPPEVIAGRDLGLRAERVRRALPVARTLVICPDEASYLDALRQWTPALRFPVLIDDGSWQAAGDIARFVRAFGPERILWHNAAETSPIEGGGEPAADIGPADFRARAEAIVARAWGVRPRAGVTLEPGVTQALDAWETFGLAPFGVVACDARHGARAAAVALAAGRAQPIAWIDSPAGVNRTMTPEQAAALNSAISGALDAIDLPWSGLGADIDAITLCAETPARIEGGPEILATTDVLGRSADDPARRWAWCGQIFGDAPQSAWRAMCALFLQPETAWLFNGYPADGPWADYALAPAATLLEEIELAVTLDAAPRGTLDAWRTRTGLGIDAGLIFVNTKGNKATFGLVGGTAQSVDVPFLQRPAAVYFIHSFSAQLPGAPATIAGKWLQRGAYAYFGSVDEPFLHWFVRPEVLAARLRGGFALGAAVRIEQRPPWKLTMLGDPLITLGPAPAQAGGDVALGGAVDFEERMRAALRAEPPDLAGAVRMLTMMGRAGDAAKLAAATMRERPEAFDSAMADAAICAALWEHDRALLLQIAARSSAEQRDDALDALWGAQWRHLRAGDAALTGAMMGYVRDAALVRDASDLAEIIRRTQGVGAAIGFLRQMRGRATRQPDQDRIDKLIEQMSR